MATPRHAIVLAFDDRYVSPGLVSATTALHHSPPECEVIILGVDLTPDSVDYVRATVDADRLTLIDASQFAHSLPARFVPAAWARLGIHELLAEDFDRLVYLDADTLTRRTLDPLFEVDLAGRVLAACVEPATISHRGRHEWGQETSPDLDYSRECPVAPVAAYFNSGVLVIDMKRWRDTEAGPRLLDVGRHIPASYLLPDQDVLNTVLWDEWLPIDWRRWNWPGLMLDRNSWEAHVVHFLGPTKPWVDQPWGAPFNREYRQAAAAIGWDIEPNRFRLKAGAIETLLPYSIVLRRHRIGAALRRTAR